jgi:hypothetical protein
VANTTPTKNTNFRVRNIANTTNVCQGGEKWKRVCRCGSWINHWRTGVLLYFPNIHPDVFLNPTCYVRGCSNPWKVGAHVLEVDGRSTQYWKIVPFCKTHNNRSFTMDVFLRKDAILVPASQQDTCSDGRGWKEALSVVKIMLGVSR